VPLSAFVRIISELLKLSNSLFGSHDGKRDKSDSNDEKNGELHVQLE
jgi:hypothetical protein